MTEFQSKLLRVILFGLGTVAVVSVFYFDLLEYLTLENILLYKGELGPWAPLVFVLAFALGELLQIPSVLWIFFAGIIWPVWLALPIALTGAMLAATAAFLIARYFLGEKFHERLPKRTKNLNQAIAKNPLKAVVLIRLSTFLHPLVHWALAASPVRLPAFLLGTFIGILPASIAIVLLGQQFLTWWDDYSFLILTACAVFVLIALIVNHRKNQDA